MLKDLAQPGDILFYKTTPKSGLTHRIIAAGELLLGLGNGDVQYNHVSIVSTFTGFQYEAVWPRLRYSKINWDDPCIEIWRYRGITHEQAGAVLRAASVRLGEHYDLVLFLTGFLKSQHAEICTGYVVDSFTAAKLSLASGGDKRLAPNVLSQDPALDRIAPCQSL